MLNYIKFVVCFFFGCSPTTQDDCYESFYFEHIDRKRRQRYDVREIGEGEWQKETNAETNNSSNQEGKKHMKN